MITKWLIGTAGVVGVAALSVGLALVFTGSSGIEVPGNERTLAAVGPSEDGGTPEGIKVHGNWVIDVRDPDGTLVEHREFQNSLSPHGRKILSEMLNSETSMSSTNGWQVNLNFDTFENSLSIYGPPIGEWLVSQCTIEPTQTCNLNVGVEDSALVLTGTGNAVADGKVTAVVTMIPVVRPPIGVAGLSMGSQQFQFTSSYIKTPEGTLAPVNVKKGQQISVTVTISFS